MKETPQGYHLPYAAEPGYQIVFLGIGVVAVAASLWFARSEGQALLLLITALFLAVILTQAAQLLARVHIVPEGISITLFDWTLRQWPAERIRVIGALRKYEGKANPHDVMAVCANTVEELTELGKRNMPGLLKNETDRWYGEAAAKYLYRRAVSFRGELNLHNHIFWLDWSPERLNMLLEMYPQAQWLDCTQKELFGEQLKNN